MIEPPTAIVVVQFETRVFAAAGAARSIGWDRGVFERWYGDDPWPRYDPSPWLDITCDMQAHQDNVVTFAGSLGDWWKDTRERGRPYRQPALDQPKPRLP